MKVKNIVFMIHEGDSKKFLFEAPLGLEIGFGQQFYVETMRGEAIATAVTENIVLPAETVAQIANGCGAYLPLKRIVAKRIEKIVKDYERKEFLNDEVPF